MDVLWADEETQPVELGGRSVQIGDEPAYMVQKNLVALGRLPFGERHGLFAREGRAPLFDERGDALGEILAAPEAAIGLALDLHRLLQRRIH